MTCGFALSIVRSRNATLIIRGRRTYMPVHRKCMGPSQLLNISSFFICSRGGTQLEVITLISLILLPFSVEMLLMHARAGYHQCVLCTLSPCRFLFWAISYGNARIVRPPFAYRCAKNTLHCPPPRRRRRSTLLSISSGAAVVQRRQLTARALQEHIQTGALSIATFSLSLLTHTHSAPRCICFTRPYIYVHSTLGSGA